MSNLTNKIYPYNYISIGLTIYLHMYQIAGLNFMNIDFLV